MTFEKIVSVATRTCDGCMDGIYPGEEYWTTLDRRRAVCSAECQRTLAIKETNLILNQPAEREKAGTL